MDSPDKKSVDEKRVKPTVIRRRTKEAEAEPVKAPSASAASATSAAPVQQGTAPVVSRHPEVIATPKIGLRHIGDIKLPQKPPQQARTSPAGGAVTSGLPPLPTTEKEDKFKKVVAPKKKKSKAELELEDIQRAGGLKQFAQQTLEDTTVEVEEPAWTPTVERVFEPTLAAGRRKKHPRREFKKTAITATNVTKKVIRVEQAITVSELSQKMGIKSSEIIRTLMGLGMMVTANQGLDFDTATLIATDYGFEVLNTSFNEETVLQETPTDEKTDLRTRAPVVTVMGHVDHGKTSLLDAIRKTKVTEKEAGGITQHIGAYQVSLPKGNITFIDTPGHQAFTKMRARGAQVTDIVILVVAADDGIMPQTIEAIDHAKAAGVPIIVAVNKIDKPGAEAEKVKRALTEHSLVPEEWGGDVICVETSAKTGKGLPDLLEMILLTAEVKELKANFAGQVKGTVIESRLDRGRGPVATVLVQRGILKTGDYAVAGSSYGRVRAMVQADGTMVKEAPPSTPVEVLGLDMAPDAGEEFFVVEDERDARRVVETRLSKKRQVDLGGTIKVSLEDLQQLIVRGEVHELPLIVKGDVAGSTEAVIQSLEKLSTEKVSVKILHSGTGGITESDVMLARASRAVIFGFNVAPEGKARALAEQEGIQIRLHSIIYEMIDDVKKAMEGLLKPTITEKFLGRALVKQVFKVSKVGSIAGCGVTEGVIRRSATVRLIRDGKIIIQGKIASLKRFKDDAREVTNGMECGIAIENFNDLKDGDVIEAFLLEETAQTL